MRTSLLPAAMDSLLAEILDAPTSVLGISYYDTAQVVRAWRTAPERFPPVAVAGVDTLVRDQRTDGSWGCVHAPAEYRLVPSLAATLALLELAPGGQPALARAAMRGLEFIAAHQHRFGPADLPDTIAVELLVPALLENLRDLLRADPPARLLPSIEQALALQACNLERLHALRRAADTGKELNRSLPYSYDILGAPPAGCDPETLFGHGQVSCSPAATATVLTWCAESLSEPRYYLEREGERLGGAWPAVAPVPVFEAAWTVTAFSRLGFVVPPARAARLAGVLQDSLGPDGTAAGPGLAADSDDTAAALFALYSLGRDPSPDCLFRYEQHDYFSTFPVERTVSTSANAHVLEAFSAALEHSAQPASVRRAVAKARGYLLGTQQDSGLWQDKWHASPYYATSSAVLALEHAGGPGVRAAAAKALDWIMATQRADGSWGRWHGTAEETACALQLLIGTRSGALPDGADHAVRRGAGFLTATMDAGPDDAVHMPLWHAKELYRPERVVRAAVLSAVHRSTPTG